MSRDDIRYCVEPGQLPGAKRFTVGQLVRDRNTGVIVRVTHLDPAHPRTQRPRSGFAWVNTTNQPGDKDHTGFCPEPSVSCFEPVPIVKTWRDRLPTISKLFPRDDAPQGPDPAQMFPRIDPPYTAEEIEKASEGIKAALESDEILGMLRRFYPPPVFRAGSEFATVEQTLAATVAGGAIGAMRAEGKSFIDSEDLARDSLDMAREIIGQRRNLTP